jgi:DnaA protein
MSFHGVPQQFRRQIKRHAQMLGDELLTILHGSPLKGKSHSACNMIYERLQFEAGTDARFVTGEGLLQEVHTAIKADKSAFSVTHKYSQCGYLVLDDFLATARQWVTPGVEKINELIRSRLDNHRQTVITTNLSWERMAKLEERLKSRLAGAFWCEYATDPDQTLLGASWDAAGPSWRHEITLLHNLCVGQTRCYDTAREMEAMTLLARMPKEGLREIALFPDWAKSYCRELLRHAKEVGMK